MQSQRQHPPPLSISNSSTTSSGLKDPVSSGGAGEGASATSSGSASSASSQSPRSFPSLSSPASSSSSPSKSATSSANSSQPSPPFHKPPSVMAGPPKKPRLQLQVDGLGSKPAGLGNRGLGIGTSSLDSAHPAPATAPVRSKGPPGGLKINTGPGIGGGAAGGVVGTSLGSGGNPNGPAPPPSLAKQLALKQHYEQRSVPSEGGMVGGRTRAGTVGSIGTGTGFDISNKRPLSPGTPQHQQQQNMGGLSLKSPLTAIAPTPTPTPVSAAGTAGASRPSKRLKIETVGSCSGVIGEKSFSLEPAAEAENLLQQADSTANSNNRRLSLRIDNEPALVASPTSTVCPPDSPRLYTPSSKFHQQQRIPVVGKRHPTLPSSVAHLPPSSPSSPHHTQLSRISVSSKSTRNGTMPAPVLDLPHLTGSPSASPASPLSSAGTFWSATESPQATRSPLAQVSVPIASTSASTLSHGDGIVDEPMNHGPPSFIPPGFSSRPGGKAPSALRPKLSALRTDTTTDSSHSDGMQVDGSDEDRMDDMQTPLGPPKQKPSLSALHVPQYSVIPASPSPQNVQPGFAFPLSNESTQQPRLPSRVPPAPAFPLAQPPRKTSFNKNKKQLSLLVPNPHDPLAGPSPPTPTSSSLQKPSERISGIRSLPPSPRIPFTPMDDSSGEGNGAEDERLKGQMMMRMKMDEMKGQLRGDGSGLMGRRKSIPSGMNMKSVIAASNDVPLPGRSSGEMQSPEGLASEIMKQEAASRSGVSMLHTKRDGEQEDWDDGADGPQEEYPYQFGPKEILDGLYLGSELNAQDGKLLKRMGISYVLNVAKEVPIPWINGQDVDWRKGTGVINEEDEEDEEAVSFSSDDEPAPPSAVPESIRSPDRPSSLLSRKTISTPNLQSTFSEHGSVVSSPATGRRGPPTASTDRSSNFFSAGPKSAIPKDDDEPPAPGFPIMSSHFEASLPQLDESIIYEDKFFQKSLSEHRPISVSYRKMPWGHDQGDLCDQFPTAFEFIDLARSHGNKVLVHCQCGVSRSASVLIGFIMRQAYQRQNGQGGKDFERRELDALDASHHAAYEFLKRKSCHIGPNMNLLYQVMDYGKRLKRMSTAPEDEDEYALYRRALEQHQDDSSSASSVVDSIKDSSSREAETPISTPRSMATHPSVSLNPPHTAATSGFPEFRNPPFGKSSRRPALSLTMPKQKLGGFRAVNGEGDGDGQLLSSAVMSNSDSDVSGDDNSNPKGKWRRSRHKKDLSPLPSHVSPAPTTPFTAVPAPKTALPFSRNFLPPPPSAISTMSNPFSFRNRAHSTLSTNSSRSRSSAAASSEVSTSSSNAVSVNSDASSSDFRPPLTPAVLTTATSTPTAGAFRPSRAMAALGIKARDSPRDSPRTPSQTQGGGFLGRRSSTSTASSGQSNKSRFLETVSRKWSDFIANVNGTSSSGVESSNSNLSVSNNVNSRSTPNLNDRGRGGDHTMVDAGHR